MTFSIVFCFYNCLPDSPRSSCYLGEAIIEYSITFPRCCPTNLYSVFSDFGTNPFNGFGETDEASEHGLTYSSSIDSVELHIRRRWQEPDCRWQGSVHAGVRFVYLLEDFQHNMEEDFLLF